MFTPPVLSSIRGDIPSGSLLRMRAYTAVVERIEQRVQVHTILLIHAYALLTTHIR